jgi:hypothetical protein
VFYLFFTFVTEPFVIVITRIVINAHAMEPILASLAVQPKKLQSSRDTDVDETIGILFCGKHSRHQPFQLSHETPSCGLSKMEITSISLLTCISQGDSSVFFYRTMLSQDLHHLLNSLQSQLRRLHSQIHCLVADTS